MERSLRSCSHFLKLFGAISLLGVQVLQANPTGEQVVAGAAGFERIGNALTVTQGTDRAVINWNSFSIGAGEITRFVQPSASSAVLNRVITANNPSQIYGTLQANGQVYLINSAGVFVGPGGVVDTAAFVASTRDLGNEEFMRGANLNFTGNSEAGILNQGKIEARQGDVFLIARQVSNEGQIMASDGTVGMVSGTEVALHALGPHNYKVRLLDVADGSGARKAADGVAEVVNQGVIEAANAELAATGNYLSLAIRNDGTVRATGVTANADGSVTLTGGAGDLVNRGVVAALRDNINGRTEGGTVSLAAKNITTDPGSILTAAGQEKGGEVKIDAKDTIYASGKIEATSSGGAGGKIVMTGERVGLVKAEVDVSGATQGGTVLAGGGLSGADPEVRNARALVMTPDSKIRADATQKGDGGKVILWSDEYTGFYGEIVARGGPQAGDGGFVETSAKWNLQALGQADVGATTGKGGSWLLDPYDVYITTIEANASSEFNNPNYVLPNVLFQANNQNAQISVDRILFALNSGQNVIVQVGPTTKQVFGGTGQLENGRGDINVEVPIIAALSSTGSLSLINNWIMSGTDGYGDINVKNPITVGGNLLLQAADDRGLPELLRPLATNGGKGGDVLVDAPIYAAGSISITAGKSVATNSGGTGGNVTINADIYAGGGLTLIGGDADQGWNTTATLPIATPYITQRASNFTLGGAIRASGGTGGEVNIADTVTIYLGNGNSVIRSGTSGANEGPGGSLVLGATILALGNDVRLTLASGVGKESGTLTINSEIGKIQGVNLAAVFPYDNSPGLPSPPSSLTSVILESLTLKSGNRVTVAAPARAETIKLQPYNPEGGMWIGQKEVQGLDVFQIDSINGVNSIENLFAQIQLSIGTPDEDNPPADYGTFLSQAGYVITSQGTTTPGQFTSVGAVVVQPPNFQVGVDYVITSQGTTTPGQFVAAGATAKTVGDLVPSLEYIITSLGTTSPAQFVSIGASTVPVVNPVTGAVNIISGLEYVITSAGTTDFTLFGAPNNNVGTIFVANINPLSPPTGTGVTLQTVFTATGSGPVGTTGTTLQTAFRATGAGVGTGATLQKTFVASASGLVGSTGKARILTGDIGIGQTGAISLPSGNVFFQGNASAVSFSGASGQDYSLGILSSGGRMTFDTGGPLFSNFGKSTADLYIPEGTVNFKNVYSVGNQPSQAPGTGVLYLDVRNIQAGLNLGETPVPGKYYGITGDSFIQISRINGSANSQNGNLLNFSGDLTTAAARVLNTFMPGNFNLTALGDINQTAGILTIPGTTSFTAGGTISLDLANQFTGAVSLSTSSGGSATIRDANSLTLGTLSVSGNLTATSTGALNLGQGTVGGVVAAVSNGNLISQTAALAVSGTGTSDLNAGAGNINLNTVGNDFVGPVNLAGATVTIVDQNNFTVGTSTVPGTLTVTAGGSILQNGTITGNDATFTAGSASSDILLNSSANLFLGAVTLSGPGGGGFRDLGFWDSGGTATLPVINATRNVTIRFDNNDITMAPVTLTGNLVLTGAGITQTGALNIDGTTTVTSTGGQDIDLATAAGNEFTGTVSLSGANVSLLNSVDLVLGASTATGNLDLVSDGSISQTGVIIVNGTADFEVGGAADDILLGTAANTFQGAVTMTSGTGTFQDLGLRNTAGTATLPVINATRSVTVQFDNSSLDMASVTLSGNLSLSATSITQAGLLDIAGATTVITSGGSIDLKNNGADNDFKSVVTLSSAGNIEVLDKNTLILGAVTTGSAGFLDVETSAGSITQSAATTISVGTGNGTVFQAGGSGAITLANQNDFRGAVSLTGGATQITDINSLTLGTLATGALTAISSGALDLGTGTITGAMAATSNGGAISQTDAGLNFGSTANFNAGAGSVTMTAGLAGGAANNVYQGNVILTAGNADFLVAAADGIGRFGQTAGSTVVPGTFTLRSPSTVDFNLANGSGGFELTSAQLGRMSAGSLVARASGIGGDLRVGNFNSAGIQSLSLVTAGNGAITADSITVGTLGISSGGTVSFTEVGGLQNNTIQNLGSVSVASGGFDFQNRSGLNLAGPATMPGRLSLEVAGQFNNQTGLESPLSGVQLGSVIKSLSLMGGVPNSVSGLSGFSYRYDGVMPASGNVMSFAVPPLTMFAPNGTVIAGVNLGGANTGGGQLATFEAGSDSLNWIVSDFAGFNLPAVRRATFEYTLYPQRVEPETRSLPEATVGQLQRELGRPPTLEEVVAREVAQRDAARVRSGALLERSSFDQDENLPQERAQNLPSGENPTEGEIPQARRDADAQKGTLGGESLELDASQAAKPSTPSRSSDGVNDAKKPARAYAMVQ